MVKFWLSLVVGLFCVLAWLGSRSEASETAAWPSTPGVITEMRITETRGNDGGRETTAVVKYSYAVNGKTYQGDRVKVEMATNPTDAQRYPKGTQVTVFYNPKQPGDAVLEQGGGGAWFTGLLGIGCLVYAGYVLIDRRKGKNAPAPGGQPAIG